MLETFTFTIVIAALVFNILNFITLKKRDSICDRECYCRYPDSNVRDIIIDYELEKAKKLDKAIHQVEDMKDEYDDPIPGSGLTFNDTETHNRNKI